MEYNINRPWETLDDWQREYIKTSGNCFLLCGRQSGKSAAMSIKIGEYAVKEEEPCEYLVIALTEKQAYSLFFKTLIYLETRYPSLICKGKNKPTKHEINLKNGVTIMCHACGLTGEGLRGYTIKKLFIDEAAPMSKEIFTAVMPMLSVTGGTLDISSTPQGKQGFFYECSLRDDFKKFYVSAEDCPRHDKAFLEQQKKTMSKLEYAQEYLAMFLDELRRLFNDDLIKKTCINRRRERFNPSGRYYIGSDLAGLGEDVSTFEIIDKINKDSYEHVENLVTSKTLTTESSLKIINLNKEYKFSKIGVDDGGVGFGVFSELLKEDSTKRKVIALNNASRPLDREGKKSKKILKEEMYFNLLMLMEQEKIKLLDDDDLIDSLKSVQFEIVAEEGKKTETRIFGSNTHIVEGLIRAAWLASEDKTLNIWAF